MIIKGFPKQHMELDMPNIGELFCQPMFMFVSADDLFKQNEFMRYLLTYAPIKNDMKYVTVITYTQFLNPNVRTIQRSRGLEPGSWHIDGYQNGSRVHMLQSECSSMTEFNVEEFTVFDQCFESEEALWSYLNTLKLPARKIDPNRFVTFDTHPHRSTTPKEREFRFMFRVLESNTRPPRTLEQARIRTSSVYGESGSMPSIEQDGGGSIKIYL